MKYFYSKIDPSILLHAVLNFKNLTPDDYKVYGNIKRIEIAPPEQFLQASLLAFDKGLITKAHKHIWKDSPEKTITQESVVVIKGNFGNILLRKTV